MLGCSSHDLIIPHMVAPFNSQQLSQTPLIESINLEYISLGNCPALRAVQKDGQNTIIIQLQLGGDGQI